MLKREITATKEFSFDCAHMLTGHQGLCQNLHGHTYKLLVTAQRRSDFTAVKVSGPSEGMVCDFSELKGIVNSVIVNKMDHAFIYNLTSPSDSVEVQIAQLLIDSEKKVVALPGRPTAENMAMEMLQDINTYLEHTKKDFEVVCIRLYETPTSYAETYV